MWWDNSSAPGPLQAGSPTQTLLMGPLERGALASGHLPHNTEAQQGDVVCRFHPSPRAAASNSSRIVLPQSNALMLSGGVDEYRMTCYSNPALIVGPCSVHALLQQLQTDDTVEFRIGGAAISIHSLRLVALLNGLHATAARAWLRRASQLFRLIHSATETQYTANIILAHLAVLEMGPHLWSMFAAGAKWPHELRDLVMDSNDLEHSITLFFPFGDHQPMMPLFQTVEIVINGAAWSDATQPNSAICLEVVEQCCPYGDAAHEERIIVQFMEEQINHISCVEQCDGALQVEAQLSHLMLPGFCLLFYAEWPDNDDDTMYTNYEACLYYLQNADAAATAQLSAIRVCKNWYAFSIDPNVAPLDAVTAARCETFQTVDMNRCDARLVLRSRANISAVAPSTLRAFWRHFNCMRAMNAVQGLLFC